MQDYAPARVRPGAAPGCVIPKNLHYPGFADIPNRRAAARIERPMATPMKITHEDSAKEVLVRKPGYFPTEVTILIAIGNAILAVNDTLKEILKEARK